MRDLEKELAERDEGWPPAWRPEAGEHLVGTILKYAEGPTAYGMIRTVIVEREDGGGRVSIWLSSTVLLDQFAKEKPRPGERVGISYQGKHETKNYHKWALVVDRPEAPLEFSPLGGERGPDPFDVDDADAENPFGDNPLPYTSAVVRGAGDARRS